MSHQRAALATAEGRFKRQIVPTFPRPGYDRMVSSDNGIRNDSSMDALGSLKPLF